MPFGNVYVFNLYVEDMVQFGLNNQGSVVKKPVASPQKTTDPPYAPSQVVVARTNLTQDQLNTPLFVNGPNDILVGYGTDLWKGTVTIPHPPAPSLSADLWLYVGYRKAFLFDTVGNMMPQGPDTSKYGGESLGWAVLEPVDPVEFNIDIRFET
jgi:hypothetical protein